MAGSLCGMPTVLTHSLSFQTSNSSATGDVGAVAALVEWCKPTKYSALDYYHTFTLVPLAIKTAAPPLGLTCNFLLPEETI